jgi:hypothetical protein
LRQKRLGGDIKLRRLQRAHVGAVGLIQRIESSPNTAPGSDTLAISTPSLMTATAPFLRIISRPVLDPDRKTVSPA